MLSAMRPRTGSSFRTSLRAAHQHAFQSTSTPWPSRITARWGSAGPNTAVTPKRTERAFYAASGTSIAVLGLFWSNAPSDGDNVDSRDAAVLSKIPLSKVITGWL